MAQSATSVPAGLFARLHQVQLGGGARGGIGRKDLVFLFRNICMLLENGLSLARTLQTLSRERTLRKHRAILDELRRRVESGESFSSGLARFPDTFGDLLVNQVRVGERAGTLAETLRRVGAQLERGGELRSQVIKKLTYPAILVVAGTACVVFMLTFVVPTFQETYAASGIALPLVTQLLMSTADQVAAWGWLVPLLAVAAAWGIRRARRKPQVAYALDRWVLQLPLAGEWIRDLIVLRFMDALGNMLESGFTVVDALRLSSGAVGNRFVQEVVEKLHSAVTRGERFSRELDRYEDLFPPIVHQLVVTGEATGKLPQSVAHIREHLRREIERTTNILVGTIEPVMTIGMALVIGVILMAIYLPIFDMVQATGH